LFGILSGYSGGLIDSAKMDEEETVRDELLAELGRAGILGLTVPRRYGGLELSATGYTMSQEDFLREEEFVFGQHETSQVPIALIEQETAILRARRGLRPNQPDDFAMFTSEGLLRNFQQISGGVAAAMIVIAGIALLVGGVGVMNIMLVNVTQRTREIGLRKALGARRVDIALQFLVEAVTLTGVGGALGIAFGLGAAIFARAVFDFEAATPLWSVSLGLGVSTAVGLIFGMWPALKAARQDPIEALRYE